MVSEDIRKTISTLSFKLKKARMQKKDTQEDLAFRIGISKPTLANMESGAEKAGSVSLASWLKAAAYLGLLDTVENFLTIPENPFEVFKAEQEEQRRIKKGRVRKSTE